MKVVAMRILPVVVGVFLLTRGAAALAACGDGTPEPPDEQCDDGNTMNGDCCSAACQFEPLGSVCPDDTNPCTADTCDDKGACEHLAANAGAVCRPPAGPCDVAETCTGIDASCPLDAKSTTPCRPAAGDCDVAESCDGVSDECPPDSVQPPTTLCRPAAGACDVAETCTGSDAVCPLDGKSTALCRPAAGDCDLAEGCDGVGNDCPLDSFRPAGTVCRAASDQCDATETCSGAGAVCPPDVSVPNSTACSDGNPCTRTDTCQAGTCSGANPVVCTPLDQCHLAGTCNPATGACSNPAKSNNTLCDDANGCTTDDACQDGACRGRPATGCCLVDADCEDGWACTADQCAAHVCLHAPLDERCGPPRDCAQLLCAPGDPAAGASGCVVRAIDESSYCSEDFDPCTIDACHGGSCRHESDRSGPRCEQLVRPYRTALDLLARARALETALQAALAVGCPSRAAATACDITQGDESARLIALLEATQLDLGTAALALAGRLAGPSSPDTPRDPLVRARLALGLLANTPTDLRGFLATLAQARARRVVAPAFARARRSEGMRLLRGARKLRGQLRRLITRRQSFAR
jgi:cysteine-rich repeat protein